MARSNILPALQNYLAALFLTKCGIYSEKKKQKAF